MSALGFVGGLAGAISIGIYGLIAFVFFTASTLEQAERGTSSRLSFWLAATGAIFWPLSLLAASLAALHASRQATERRKDKSAAPSYFKRRQASSSMPDYGTERPHGTKAAVHIVRGGKGTSEPAAASAQPDDPSAQKASGASPAAAEPPPGGAASPDARPSREHVTSRQEKCGKPLSRQLPFDLGPMQQVLAPLQVQPQPPCGQTSPASRSRVISQSSPGSHLTSFKAIHRKPATPKASKLR